MIKKLLVISLFWLSGSAIILGIDKPQITIFDRNLEENRAIKDKQDYENNTNLIIKMVNEILNLYTWPLGKPTISIIFDKDAGPAALSQHVDNQSASLTINYKDFLQRSISVQRFLIAHEIGHYLQYEENAHTRIDSIFFNSFVPGLALEFNDVILHRIRGSSQTGAVKRLVSLLGYTFLVFLFARFKTRIDEYDADARAAKALGTAKGGIEFLRSANENHSLYLEITELSLTLSKMSDNLLTPAGLVDFFKAYWSARIIPFIYIKFDYFLDHPLPMHRITALENLEH